MSKLKAKFNFLFNNIIKSKNYIRNKEMIIPVHFVGGNNEIFFVLIYNKIIYIIKNNYNFYFKKMKYLTKIFLKDAGKTIFFQFFIEILI